MAKAMDPSLPDWALDEVRASNPLATVPLSAAVVAKLAKIVIEHVPPPAQSPEATKKGAKK
jgi:hypothetical protein